MMIGDWIGLRLFYSTWWPAASPTLPIDIWPPTGSRWWILGAMSYDQPARDGSTCGLMARSLRKMIQLDFQLAYDVHSGLSSRQDFQRSIDVNWNWLDGNSLLWTNLSAYFYWLGRHPVTVLLRYRTNTEICRWKNLSWWFVIFCNISLFLPPPPFLEQR